MTIFDWKEFDLDSGGGTDGTAGLVAFPSENPAISTFQGQAFPMVQMGKWMIWPYYGTVNGKRATGWNEGVIEYWQYGQNTGSQDLIMLLKIYPIHSNRNYYRVTWDWNIGSGQVRVEVHKNDTLFNTQADTSIPPPNVTGWSGMRTQFRWVDTAKASFEFKVWGNKNDGNGWISLIPAGKYTFSGANILADNNDNAFAIGGGELDNTLNRRNYYDNFSIKRLSFPPL